MSRGRFLIAVMLMQAIVVLPAAAEKRVALVIGNASYVQAGTLTNPVNDAGDAARVLTKFGFDVILGLDLDRRAFDEKIRAFSRALANADTAVLFYAGHGLQVAGRNYLIPVDAALKTERDLDFEAISLDFVLRQMEVDREGKTNVVFLDACRDNPFARNLARSMGTRSASVGRGLAEMQTGVGTFIAFSTQPGNVALDGDGRNSPFTAAFANRVQEPGRNLTAIMIDVRKDVLAATGGRQVPWDHSALTSDFFFQPAGVRSDKDEASPGEGVRPRRRDDAGSTRSADQLVAELDALAVARNWHELHDRLTDVSPTSRDAHWNDLVEQAALGELAPLTAPGGSAAERLAAIDRYYPKFPSLGDSTNFLALRTTVGLDAFARCFDERGGARTCRDDLERFVHSAPVSAELARGAAHIVGVKFNRQAASLFYVTALDVPGGEAVCTDSELEYDLIVALQLPPDYREAKAARTIAERCWDAVKTAVVANVARESEASYYLQNTCPGLIQRKALTGLREKRCQAVIQSKKESPQ